MKYTKPEIEVIGVDNDIFMADSVNFSSASEALAASCGGYDGGKTNKFSCSDFGGYNASNPPTQKSKVTLAGGTYVFDYVGNHWKLEK
ncbi:MAG: hypothetical protein K6E83_04655 [Clostridium sp.]|nr:hypothetical protein [Clostridium sp.]